MKTKNDLLSSLRLDLIKDKFILNGANLELSSAFKDQLLSNPKLEKLIIKHLNLVNKMSLKARQDLAKMLNDLNAYLLSVKTLKQSYFGDETKNINLKEELEKKLDVEILELENLINDILIIKTILNYKAFLEQNLK